MRKKIISLNLFLLSSIILCVGCGQEDSEKDLFINDTYELMNSIQNSNGLNSDYYVYRYEDNSALFLNYNINDGIIIVNKNGEQYLSVENDKYCAVKDFNESKLTIYNIDNREKCHLNITSNEELSVSLIGKNIEGQEYYSYGTVSDGFISLSALHNILDDFNYIYTWYRNGEEIPNSNVQTYTITSEIEDADYYVEIITPNGEVYKSEPVNVKINRKV